MFSVDLSTRECDGHVIVTLHGDLDITDAANVAAALAAVAASEPEIIVDLAALKFIDSSGVAALARGRKYARQAGGDLPVQPFLACASDVVARLGTLRLEAVQVLLPERDAPGEEKPGSRSAMRLAWPLFDALDWFADCDPRLRAAGHAGRGGPDPSIRAAAPATLRWVHQVRQREDGMRPGTVHSAV